MDKPIGPAYKSTTLSEQAGSYVARVDKPVVGWTAFFVELTYPSGGKYPFKFTTADTLAFPARPRS